MAADRSGMSKRASMGQWTAHHQKSSGTAFVVLRETACGVKSAGLDSACRPNALPVMRYSPSALGVMPHDGKITFEWILLLIEESMQQWTAAACARRRSL
jgi:hypothetical protein